MTSPIQNSSVSTRRTARAIVIALVIGVSVGTIVLLGLRMIRAPKPLPLPTTFPITMGTADHWRRIDSIANIVDVQAFSDGSIWALFAGGAIGRLDNDQWTLMPDNVMGDAIIEIPNSKSTLWVIGNAIWSTADRGTSWQAVDLGTAFADNKTTLWSSVGGDGLWIASDSALAHYVKGVWTSVQAQEGTTLLPSRGLLSVRDGSVWITVSKSGVPSALARYDGQWHIWENAHPRSEIRFMEDAKGGVWFATANGTAYCDRQTITFYSLTQMAATGSSPKSDVMLDSGVMDRQGGVWWMAANGQIFHYDGIRWQSYSSDDLNFPASQSGVQHSGGLIADAEGNIWVGGEALARFKNGQWQTFDPVNGDPFAGGMNKLYITYGRPLARDGSLWFGVSAAGVVHYDGRNWIWFGPQNGALKMPVTAKVHDSYLPLASTADGGVLLYQTFEHAVYRYVP